MSNAPKRTIAIIGYGTAGQAASLYLQAAGHRIRHFEQAPELQPVGAGFLLQPTGLSVLDELGLGQSARACGARVERLYGENERGRRVMDMQYAELDPDWHGLGMQRGALFELLRQADVGAALVQCGIAIDSVDAVAGLLQDSAGQVHGPFDLIVVANGAHSKLRQLSGIDVLRDALYPWGAIWCLAPDPSARHAGQLQQRYRRAREMIGVLPVGQLPAETQADARVSLFWSVRTEALQAECAASIDSLRSAFSALWPQAGALLGDMTDRSAWRAASYRDVVLRQPFREHVVFIGDAAHGMSPQLGQGVNMALLDARSLAQSLDRHAALADALAAYASERAAHLRIYQFLSRWLTPLFQSDLDTLAWWRDLLFLPLSRLPFSRSESLKILTGIKRGWFGRLRW
ncbi:MAG: FAD-dependent oxidoreductase [Lysobacterales bacterium]